MNNDLEKFRNILIVCEGIDHCGKSTVAKALVDFLNNVGIPSVYTFQPGDTQYGQHAEIMRDFCTRKTYDLNPLSNFFAFLLDRSEQTSKVVLPAIKDGKTVVSDRWWYSTIAYQFYGKQLLSEYNLDDKFINWMNELASHYLEPNVVLYFNRPQELVDTTPENQQDRFETETDRFKSRVKDAYLKMLTDNPKFREIIVDNDIGVTLNRVIEVDVG